MLRFTPGSRWYPSFRQDNICYLPTLSKICNRQTELNVIEIACAPIISSMAQKS